MQIVHFTTEGETYTLEIESMADLFKQVEKILKNLKKVKNEEKSSRNTGRTE